MCEIIEGEPKLIEIWPNEKYVPIIVLRHEQRIYCYINQCPHAGWPLETVEGKFLFSADGDIICAGHGASFDVTDGRCMGGPGRGLPLKTYPFKILNDEIIIGELK